MNGEDNVSPSIPTQGGPEHHSSGPVKTLIAIIVLAVLVGVAVLLQQNFGDSSLGREEIADGQFLTRADEGDVVDSFPEEFLIDETEEVGISESFKIEYENDGVLFSVVKYTSSISLTDNINAFTNVLSSEGWSVSEFPAGALAPGAATQFRALRGSEETATIQFTDADGGIDVVISHTRSL